MVIKRSLSWCLVAKLMAFSFLLAGCTSAYTEARPRGEERGAKVLEMTRALTGTFPESTTYSWTLYSSGILEWTGGRGVEAVGSRNKEVSIPEVEAALAMVTKLVAARSIPRGACLDCDTVVIRTSAGATEWADCGYNCVDGEAPLFSAVRWSVESKLGVAEWLGKKVTSEPVQFFGRRTVVLPRPRRD